MLQLIFQMNVTILEFLDGLCKGFDLLAHHPEWGSTSVGLGHGWIVLSRTWLEAEMPRGLPLRLSAVHP